MIYSYINLVKTGKLVLISRVSTRVDILYRPLAVTSQVQLLSVMLEGKVKVWNTEISTNVKRATRKGLLPDYYSILAIIFNIIHVFFSKTFFVLFCFPSNMAAKYAVRHVRRHAKVVYINTENVLYFLIKSVRVSFEKKFERWKWFEQCLFCGSPLSWAEPMPRTVFPANV